MDKLYIIRLHWVLRETGENDVGGTTHIFTDQNRAIQFYKARVHWFYEFIADEDETGKYSVEEFEDSAMLYLTADADKYNETIEYHECDLVNGLGVFYDEYSV